MADSENKGSKTVKRAGTEGFKDCEEAPEATKDEEFKDCEEVKEEVKAEQKDVDMKGADEAKDGDEAKASGEAPEKEKEPEKPKETETDAADDSRPKVAAADVDVNLSDTTLNALPTSGNRLLMSLTEGGFQHLLAGARCTAGLTAGRYMFEVRMIEAPGGNDAPNDKHGKAPQPRNVLRIGLSLAGSSLLLGDGTPESICFDSEGFLYFGRSRKKVSGRFGRDHTVAVVVNLDPASPNANTISLFKDGHRVAQPQAIPEALLGKPLFPTVTYRSATAMVNFGPQPLVALPFTCRTVGEAAAADVKLAKAVAPAGGKYEVVFPVGLPAAGFFDWVDTFLEKHPDYVELSDRKIVEWAVKSGMWRPKGPGHSNDKPDMKFGIPTMDDMSVSRLIKYLAPISKRNFIVPELKANLLEADRKKALARFNMPHFKKTACVFVGEPSAEFTARVQELVIRDKRRKAEAERKRKGAEEARSKAAAERKKKVGEKKANGKADKVDEEAKEGEGEEHDDAKGDDSKMDEDIVVELSAEEKAMKFRKTYNPDVTDAVLSKVFANFTVPTKEEGFDSVTFDWDGEAAATKTLKDWVFAKKLTQRVEDLAIGESFKESWSAWTKQMSEWKKHASVWKDPAKRKAFLEKRAEAKKKAAEEKGDEAAAKDAEKEPEIDLEELDVFAVENIDDIGNGMPLYADFAYEDWTLLSTRYEMHLLLHCFKKDLNDSDRPSFAEKDLSFYYSKYFKKNFSLKSFGYEKLSQLQDLMKDTFSVNGKSGFLEAALPDDTPLAKFVKWTEDHRRERARRLDAGDETAEVKFPREQSSKPGGGGGGGKSGSWGSGKSSGKGDRKGSSKGDSHKESSSKGSSKGKSKESSKGSSSKGSSPKGKGSSSKDSSSKGSSSKGSSPKGSSSKGSSPKGSSKGTSKGSSSYAGGTISSYRSSTAPPEPRSSGASSRGGGYSSAPPRAGGYSSAAPAARTYASTGGSSYSASKYPRTDSYSGGGGSGGGYRR